MVAVVDAPAMSAYQRRFWAIALGTLAQSE